MAKPKIYRLCIDLDPSEKRALERLCSHERLFKAMVIRRLILTEAKKLFRVPGRHRKSVG